MSRWLQRVLRRIRKCVAERNVRFTLKALHEIAELDIDCDEQDVLDLLRKLRSSDSARRLRSRLTGEWMYVFKPQMAGIALYLKVILRGDGAVVVSRGCQ